MSKQNIFIIGFNLLYEILDEIKDNLSSKIIKYANEDDFIKASILDIKDSLFISKVNKKLLLNKNLSEKNFLDLNNFPLPYSKLTELINIQLIKLRFNYQSKINIKGYELNLNSKFFCKDDLSLRLTEKEIEIILYLNETKTKHDVLDLQKNIWGYSAEMETHTVETHIYRLRKKISNKFNDENLILSHQNGYFIDKKEV
jgi:hypothetical protein|tara:strand:- start:1503 stop:2102 length:600 start_codon:yes stop_codon:yes gene_type:complete